MLEHRMAGERAELADDAQIHRPRVRALELDLALAEIGLDAGQPAEEVVIPECASKFTVGDGLQPHRLLPLDRVLDSAVLRNGELIGCVLAALSLPTRLLQGGGAK